MTQIKTNKGFVFQLDIKECDENSFIFYAKDIETNKRLGFVSFRIDDKNRNHVWMQKIEVYKKYQGKGIGQALLTAFEYNCVKNNVDTVEGKYYPTNQAAVNMYKKNRYEISQETYGKEIFKYLSKSTVMRKYREIKHDPSESGS